MTVDHEFLRSMPVSGLIRHQLNPDNHSIIILDSRKRIWGKLASMMSSNPPDRGSHYVIMYLDPSGDPRQVTRQVQT
jgi:hypothetical protein